MWADEDTWCGGWEGAGWALPRAKGPFLDAPPQLPSGGSSADETTQVEAWPQASLTLLAAVPLRPQERRLRGVSLTPRRHAPGITHLQVTRGTSALWWAPQASCDLQVPTLHRRTALPAEPPLGFTQWLLPNSPKQTLSSLQSGHTLGRPRPAAPQVVPLPWASQAERLTSSPIENKHAAPWLAGSAGTSWCH